jgi:hypothetical protein
MDTIADGTVKDGMMYVASERKWIVHTPPKDNLVGKIALGALGAAACVASPPLAVAGVWALWLAYKSEKEKNEKNT